MQMKRIVSLVCLLIPTAVLAAIPMKRVVGVIDSHTIVVESNGRQPVVLKDVQIPAAEESAAIEHLHRLLDGAWVYVEEGGVYRSPDGLYVNGELQRHAWRSVPNMRYLGVANPGPRPHLRPSVKAAAPAVKRPARSAARVSRPTSRRRGRVR